MEVLICVCVVILAPYVLGPILIWRTQRIAAELKVETFAADDPALPAEASAYCQRTSKSLAPLGFELVTGMALPGHVVNVKALVFLWVNRQAKDTVDAACIYVDTPKGSQWKMSYIGVSTRFRDGTVLRTNNAGLVGSFPKRPGFFPQSFPMIKDAGRLYRLHQARLERHDAGSDKILRLDEEFHGNAAAYQARIGLDELEDATNAGFLQLSADGKLYRPTWKGALLMTWGQCWPIKWIRGRLRLGQAKRLLAELESPEGLEGSPAP
jgi:hypothetical protein